MGSSGVRTPDGGNDCTSLSNVHCVPRSSRSRRKTTPLRSFGCSIGFELLFLFLLLICACRATPPTPPTLTPPGIPSAPVSADSRASLVAVVGAAVLGFPNESFIAAIAEAGAISKDAIELQQITQTSDASRALVEALLKGVGGPTGVVAQRLTASFASGALSTIAQRTGIPGGVVSLQILDPGNSGLIPTPVSLPPEAVPLPSSAPSDKKKSKEDFKREAAIIAGCVGGGIFLYAVAACVFVFVAKRRRRRRRLAAKNLRLARRAGMGPGGKKFGGAAPSGGGRRTPRSPGHPGMGPSRQPSPRFLMPPTSTTNGPPFTPSAFPNAPTLPTYPAYQTPTYTTPMVGQSPYMPMMWTGNMNHIAGVGGGTGIPSTPNWTMHHLYTAPFDVLDPSPIFEPPAYLPLAVMPQVSDAFTPRKVSTYGTGGFLQLTPHYVQEVNPFAPPYTQTLVHPPAIMVTEPPIAPPAALPLKPGTEICERIVHNNGPYRGPNFYDPPEPALPIDRPTVIQLHNTSTAPRHEAGQWSNGAGEDVWNEPLAATYDQAFLVSHGALPQAHTMNVQESRVQPPLPTQTAPSEPVRPFMVKDTSAFGAWDGVYFEDGLAEGADELLDQQHASSVPPFRLPETPKTGVARNVFLHPSGGQNALFLPITASDGGGRK